MEFKKYQHVERFGNSEVEGIEFGTVYIFPKIDGTNSQLYLNNDELCAGSRKRELSIENDNAGFFKYATENEKYKKYLKKHPTHRLFGEWLVPHSLKTYRKNAWKNFYVFDVGIDKSEQEIRHEGDSEIRYLDYEYYKVLLEEFDINYIPPISILINATYEKLIEQLEKNIFLIEDGKGAGEGIVIKNYGYENKYGRQTWAKIVTSEFKEKHAKVMGAPSVEYKKMIEEDISDNFITYAFCEKVLAKIKNENDGFNSRDIPRLLNTVFYDLIKEESWEIVKKYKNPIINYKTLRHFVVEKTKQCLPNIF